MTNIPRLPNFSLVITDYTKQGMPCVNGKPSEFKNQDEFAMKWKTKFPGARVMEYRINAAVFYDPLVHDKLMVDP